MDKTRELRYQSATELRAALLRVKQAVEPGKVSAPEWPITKQETRFLEAAAPKEATLGCSIEVIAMIRENESTGGLRELLRTEDAPHLSAEDVRERSFDVEFPLDEKAKPQPLDITLRLESPGFDPQRQTKKLKVPPRGDSPACTFFIIPRLVGDLVINLELLNIQEQVLASRSIRTHALPAGAETTPEKVVVTIPLTLLVTRIGDRILEMAPMTAKNASQFDTGDFTGFFGTDHASDMPAEASGQIKAGPQEFTEIFGDDRDADTPTRVFKTPPTDSGSRPELVDTPLGEGRPSAGMDRGPTAGPPTGAPQPPKTSQKYAGTVLRVGVGERESISGYRLLEEIRQGGMGTVYKAEDPRLGRTVALKLFRADMLRHEAGVAQFLREAKGIFALSHPNIQAVYDVGVEEGWAFIAMEFLEGSPLDQMIGGRAMDIGKVVSLAIEIADGLGAAHSKGIIHRDINPANIYVTDSGHAKIDFGLENIGRGAADDSAEIAVTDLVGSLAYMSPEQLGGQSVDHRSDIFSFGAVLYEMITGKRAFHGASLEEVVSAILNRQPEPVSGLNPQVPHKLVDIVRKALEKDRALRYQHAADMRADLLQLTSAPKSGLWARLFRRRT
ncbi:MAG TPA: serine/threonine-protein kinase [Terriglobales bacterium]